jgi:hypothetical protein
MPAPTQDYQGFILPELIVESIIRDGIQNVNNDPTIIDSVFQQLTRSYNSRKYGANEIAKIKTLLTKPIAVVYSYHEVDAKVPCFSIVVGSDTEDKALARLNDYEDTFQEDIIDAGKLAALIKVANVLPLTYDTLSGRITVADSVDLSDIYKGCIFVDGANAQHEVLQGIDNTPGEKAFFIAPGSTVDMINPGDIRSSLNYEEFEVRGVTGNVQLVIGCHSKDALTTKYLYILLKYFILSRKYDMIKRCMFLATYSGSDFNRDSAYVADQVFTRYLTINAKVEDRWRSDQVVLIDQIIIEPEPID